MSVDGNEGHSGEQSSLERRKEHNQNIADNEVKTTAIVDGSMHDDGLYTFTGVAKEAQVICTSPIVRRDKAEVPGPLLSRRILERIPKAPSRADPECTKPDGYNECSSLQDETYLRLDEG
jgi:hypothetical protein